MGHIIYKVSYHINWCSFLFHQQYASELQWIFKRLKFLFKKTWEKIDIFRFTGNSHVSNISVYQCLVSLPQYSLSEATYMLAHLHDSLVGGFNPSENISQIGSFPQVGLKRKNIWNHQLIHYQHFSISLYSTLPEFEETVRNLHHFGSPVLEVAFDNQVLLFSWDQVLFSRSYLPGHGNFPA